MGIRTGDIETGGMRLNIRPRCHDER